MERAKAIEQQIYDLPISSYPPRSTYDLFIYAHINLFCSRPFGETEGVFTSHMYFIIVALAPSALTTEKKLWYNAPKITPMKGKEEE